MKTKLQMDFVNEGGKKFQIALDDPREDLEVEEVTQAMEAIITNNVFTVGMLDLVEAKGARIVTTEVQEFDFE